MTRYVARRLLLLVPTIFGIVLVVFIALHLIPGDPATALLGQHAGPEAMAAIRQHLGLDRPLPVQFLYYVRSLARLDLGTSVFTRTPVIVDIGQRLPVTVTLTFFSMVIAVVAGMALGIAAAVRRSSLADYLSMSVALLGVSMPIFWLALLMILYLSVDLRWFEPSGIASVQYVTSVPARTHFFLIDSLLAGNGAAFWNGLSHLVMPGVALATIPMALIARITRSSLLEVMGQDYVRTAFAKGLPGRAVVWKHALKNAMLPVVTVIGLQFGSLLSGAVITESVFALPGLGRYIVTAIFNRDYPAVQGAVLVFAVLFVLLNLAVDLVYTLVDPRIRYD